VSAIDPVISVIIPTRNRSALLRACLAGLARQSLDPTLFEVIVVDDGSSDDTPRVLRESSTPYRLRTMRTAGLRAGAARNQGAELGTANLLLFIDDDVEPTPELVAEHLAAHGAPSVVALGRLDTRLRQGAGGLERHLARWWGQHDDRVRNNPDRPGWTDCYGGNVSIEREAFESVGGFAEDLARSDDVELGYRLHLAGQRFVYLELAAATQTNDKPFRRLMRDAEGAGEVAPELYRRHPGMLARLELGRYGQARRRAMVARSVLLRTGLSDALLALMDRMPMPAGLADRWYSFLTTLAYWRGVRRALRASGDLDTWRRLTTPPVILMYHAFGRPGEAGSRWVVPITSLAAQLRVLRRLGRTVVPLGELITARRQHQVPPAGAVAITIDDGYRDVLDALPVFDREGAHVTLFLVSQNLGRENDWDEEGLLAGRPLMDETALAALDPNLVSLGAHTRTHPDLREVDATEARTQIEGSAADLAGRDLLSTPAVFAYPYGRSSPEAAEIVRTSFEAALTTHPGFIDPVVPDHELGRLTVSGTDSLARFGLNLLLGDAGPVDRLVRRRRPPQSASTGGGAGPTPRIAVVIPTMGRVAELERCLLGLRDGRRPPDEVVVVDQSDGGSIEAAVRDLDSGWTSLQRIATPPRGVSIARNLGWRSTTGSIVAFTDDDCVPDQGWLAAVELALGDDATLDATTGRVLGLGLDAPGMHAVSSRTDQRDRTYAGRTLPWRVGTGGNLAVRREALERVQGFDPRLGPGSPGEAAEDLDLVYRLLAAGSRIRYEPKALVYHERQSTIRRRLSRTRYGHGLGAFAGVTVRRGDPYGAVLLAAWVAERSRLLAGAMLRPWRPRAADRALDERLLLRGVGAGLVHGLFRGARSDRPDDVP
jgi:glycosyltransferase involved in cell wall biosynthesis/peptidoglycan/xylan/chitin deacetylase (PgdA/CDA1 family)